jgi:acylphosphatase
MIRRRVVVHGIVQGVGFRHAVWQRAQSAGVAGWVRNRADGRVEAVFEGDLDAVERLVRLCRTGPRSAYVERVEVVDEEPERLSGFVVR